MTLRVATDGTLRGALATATRTGAGPDGLRPDAAEQQLLGYAAGVFMDDSDEPSPGLAAERDRLLAPIRDARLRAHVWTPYLDMSWARDADGTLVGADPAVRYPSPDERPGMVWVHAWDLAYYGEISLAVMQTGGRPPVD